MNVSKVLALSAAAASVVGVIGFSSAQNINFKSPSNTTQTQSDAAIPCQSAPFNPHLPQSARQGNASPSTDCVTPQYVQVQAQAATPVEPAPYIAPVQIAQPEPAPAQQPATVYSAPPSDVSAMPAEREPRADRN